jgi:hypothetical protein
VNDGYRMPSTVQSRPKSVTRGLAVTGKRRGGKSGMPRAKASGKAMVYHHPAAFGEAARKYAGIVRSGVGNLSTREGFDD